MALVLDVYHAPSVLAAPDLLAIDDNRFLAANYGKGDNILK